jgi:putative FmdB family regulatory protein
MEVSVPIYVYRCDCGHRFERLVARDAAAPACPECGDETRKVPAGPRLGGRAETRPGIDRTPIPWRGVRASGPEKLQREIEFRQQLGAVGVRETDTATPEPSGGTAAPAPSEVD